MIDKNASNIYKVKKHGRCLKNTFHNILQHMYENRHDIWPTGTDLNISRD